MFPHPVSASIVLRILQDHHADELFALTERNRKYLRRWLPWLDATTRTEHTRDFIRHSLKGFSEAGTVSCGIWHHGTLCGVVGYNAVDWESKTAFIGYWLAEEHQGKGIISDSCRTLIRHAFEEYRMERIVIHVAEGNVKSQAIAARLGFIPKGIKKDAEWLYDHHVDHVINVLDRP